MSRKMAGNCVTAAVLIAPYLLTITDKLSSELLIPEMKYRSE